MASFWKRASKFSRSFAALVMWRVQVWHQVTVVVLGQLLTLHWELLTFGAVFPSLEKSHFFSPPVTTGATPSLPAPSVAS